jgi:hypothetical protein
MHIHDMTEGECRAELERVSVGRLGCARDDQPYVIPMRFSYDGAHLYGFSTLGKKIDWMRSNPLVCVEFDERTSHSQWVSVVVSGRYQALPDPPYFELARVRAHGALRKLPNWWEPAFVATRDGQRLTPVFYRIQVMHLTGHRATPESADAVVSGGNDPVTERSSTVWQSIEGVMAHLSLIHGRRSTR